MVDGGSEDTFGTLPEPNGPSTKSLICGDRLITICTISKYLAQSKGRRGLKQDLMREARARERERKNDRPNLRSTLLRHSCARSESGA